MKHDHFHPEAIKLMRKQFKISDMRTWPYYPIIIPLKGGLGPVDDAECDEITWQVWDVFCNDYGTFKCLADAVNLAIEMNADLLELQ